MKIVPVSDTSTRMRLSVEHFDALDIPASLVELRTLTAGMLPRIDLPELLLEVHAWTGYLNSYVHVSGENTRMTTGQGLPPDGPAASTEVQTTCSAASSIAASSSMSEDLGPNRAVPQNVTFRGRRADAGDGSEHNRDLD